MERGNCVGLDTEMFFPPPGGTMLPEVREACATCPVAEQCRDYAIAEGLKGIWGGLSEAQRRRLKPKRRTDICVNGHRWTPETTHIQSNGRRRCRLCRADATRRYNARQKSAA